MTNRFLIVAGVLSLGLTGIHVIGGGQDVHVPLLQSNADDVVKGFASVVWHGVTAALLICSVMLLVAATNDRLRVGYTAVVLAFYLAFAGLFLGYGMLRFGSVLLMPPWIGFLIISAVAAMGLWFSPRSKPLA